MITCDWWIQVNSVPAVTELVFQLFSRFKLFKSCVWWGGCRFSKVFANHICLVPSITPLSYLPIIICVFSFVEFPIRIQALCMVHVPSSGMATEQPFNMLQSFKVNWVILFTIMKLRLGSFLFFSVFFLRNKILETQEQKAKRELLGFSQPSFSHNQKSFHEKPSESWKVQVAKERCMWVVWW